MCNHYHVIHVQYKVFVYRNITLIVEHVLNCVCRFFSANMESSTSGRYVGVIGGLVAVIIMLIITIVTLLCKKNEGTLCIPLM